MNLDIGKSFTFITEDPEAGKKIAIGGGLALAWVISFVTIIGWIPIGLILTGYLIQLTRNVIAGTPHPLPEWTNWGERIIDGLKGWLVGFVYSLPATIVYLAFSLPSIISSIGQAVSGTTANSGVAAATSGLSAGGACLSWIIGVIVGFFVPIAIGRYAATNNLGAAFQIGAVFNILKQNFVTYLVIALLAGVVLSIISWIGVLAICIGAAFTWFYSQLVLYHLYGQAYRQAEGFNTPPAYGQPYQQRPF